MEDLRTAARESLQHHADFHALPAMTLPAAIAIPDSFNALWQEISSRNLEIDSEICEELLVVQGFLDSWGSKGLSLQDEEAVNYLYGWASRVTLPSPVFAETLDLNEMADDKKGTIESSRLRSSIAVSVLSSLTTILPIGKAADKPDIIIALASFTSENDPWTTSTSNTKATEVLKSYTNVREGAFWSVIEQILKERIKPLFTKTRNPAITATGRKNFHPAPLPRFDTSVLDPETKPWKIHDVYATTVFAWIIAQYHSTDREYLEKHFPLLIPPTLALIDDETLSFKTRGCTLLTQLLKPIRESHSDILQRTNLSSVFEDAIKPCFYSLPTITSEDDSIRLLDVAYPALLVVLKTAHQPADQASPDTQDQYKSAIARILRNHLIPSLHHITSSASFPYPNLSTLLLTQVITILPDLAIHTTKYLQELIPILYSTLSNPFGPAHLPLLRSAVAAMRAVILNAHPRIWRWRGEILGAVCACWVYALEEEGEIAEWASRRRGEESDQENEKALALARLKRELRGVVYLLKVVLENQGPAGDVGQLEARENIGMEVRELVDADDDLGELLLGHVDVQDGGYFGFEL